MSDQVDQLRVSEPNKWARAHVFPFVLFMVMLLALQFGGEFFKWDHPASPWWRRWPEQWVYPLQSIICLLFLLKNWRYYEFRWNVKWALVGVMFGTVGIGFWLLPAILYDRLGLTGETQGWLKWLGVQQRSEGFDPHVFADPVAYWASLILRFFRAAIVVALIEEIFWRGFLMRFIADTEGHCCLQPFGKHTWRAFVACTLAFTLAHAPVDYAAAVIYGSLTYLLCIVSKNLGACVIMHATANFLMGCFIIVYGKYGLW